MRASLFPVLTLVLLAQHCYVVHAGRVRSRQPGSMIKRAALDEAVFNQTRANVESLVNLTSYKKFPTATLQGVPQAAKEFFASNRPKQLLELILEEGGQESDVVADPILQTARLIKQAMDTKEKLAEPLKQLGKSMQDVHAELFKQLDAATSLQVCSGDGDCREQERCTAKGTCAPIEGAVASGEQEVKRQYALYAKLREKCTPKKNSDKVLQQLRSGGKFTSLKNAETSVCASKRLAIRQALADLYTWTAKYTQAENPARSGEGRLTRRDYREIWFHDADYTDVQWHEQCIEHSGCQKYFFCSKEHRCERLEDCLDSIAIDGQCPEDVPPPASALCENDDTEDGCCWSTCGVANAFRRCGASGAQLTPWVPALHSHHEGSRKECSNVYYGLGMNFRAECCTGATAPRNRVSVNPYCCPYDSCDVRSGNLEGLSQMDDEENEKYDGTWIDWEDVAAENRTAQMADQTFSVIPDRSSETDSMYQMIQRRVIAVDTQFRTLERECPVSLSYLLRQKNEVPGTEEYERLIRASEAGRCMEGGSMKKSMTRWASMHILEHVLPMQATWATAMCPGISSKLQQEMQKLNEGPTMREEIQAELFNGVLNSLMSKSGTEKASPFADLGSNARQKAEKWYTNRQVFWQTYLEWDKQCAEWQDISFSNVTVSWEDGKLVVTTNGERLDTVVTKAERRLLEDVSNHALLYNLWNDGVNLQTNLQTLWDGVSGSDSAVAWLQSASWLSQRVGELYQDYSLLNADKIESFCIATAMRFSELDREIKM